MSKEIEQFVNFLSDRPYLKSYISNLSTEDLSVLIKDSGFNFSIYELKDKMNSLGLTIINRQRQYKHYKL